MRKRKEKTKIQAVFAGLFPVTDVALGLDFRRDAIADASAGKERADASDVNRGVDEEAHGQDQNELVDPFVENPIRLAREEDAVEQDEQPIEVDEAINPDARDE